MDHHHWWKCAQLLGDDDWGVAWHRLSLQILQEAGAYDRLDVCNVACVELVLRHVQLIEHAYAQDADGRSTGKGGKGGRVQEKTVVAEEQEEGAVGTQAVLAAPPKIPKSALSPPMGFNSVRLSAT